MRGRTVIAIVIISVLGGSVYWTSHQRALRLMGIGNATIRMKNLYSTSIYDRVTNYFFAHQAFPSQNSDVGLPDPNDLAWSREGFKSVAIKSGGRTTFSFRDPPENYASPLYEITLTVSLNEQLGKFSVTCTSKNIPLNILEKLPGSCPPA